MENIIGKVHKNSDGVLGIKCNNCGGYGFTNNMTGGSQNCNDCESTGISTPTRSELLKRLEKLENKT